MQTFSGHSERNGTGCDGDGVNAPVGVDAAHGGGDDGCGGGVGGGRGGGR